MHLVITVDCRLFRWLKLSIVDKDITHVRFANVVQRPGSSWQLTDLHAIARLAEGCFSQLQNFIVLLLAIVSRFLFGGIADL